MREFKNEFEIKTLTKKQRKIVKRLFQGVLRYSLDKNYFTESQELFFIKGNSLSDNLLLEMHTAKPKFIISPCLGADIDTFYMQSNFRAKKAFEDDIVYISTLEEIWKEEIN